MNEAIRSAPAASSDVALRDWDDLLAAVKERLREAMRGRNDIPPGSSSAPSTARLQDTVAECVAALDQLHATLEHELGRCRLLGMEIADAQSALARHARFDRR